MPEKQFSEACERNQEPILDALLEAGVDSGLVWEIGSGTGQHAHHLASNIPNVVWQPSDLGDRHDSVEAWTAEDANVRPPISFDLFQPQTPVEGAVAVVCINTIHIAPWEATNHLFRHAASALEPGGIVFLYGPFRFADRELEPSNENFDRWLKNRDPDSGLRLYEDVNAVAGKHGFSQTGHMPMPANNHSFWWTKK